MSAFNLPPGCSMRDVDPPDERTLIERMCEYMAENRELPQTDEVMDFVLRRLAKEDMEPTPDEVLAWLKKRAFIDDCPLCGGLGYWHNGYGDKVACSCRGGCPQCGHSPCACAKV